MGQIIITLTTVPNRLFEDRYNSGTKMSLITLLTQNKYMNMDYEVHLNIPNENRGEPINELPEWLLQYEKEYTHLKIFMTPDYGPVTKLLPTLQRTHDPDAIIIIADDDLYYMQDIIEHHIKAREKYPECAIGFAGITAIDGSCHFCTTVDKDVRVRILEGYKTVSFKRSFFSDLDDFKTNFSDICWADDISVSAYLGYRDIKKMVINYSLDTDFRPRVESYPVIGGVAVERGGCNVFRDDPQVVADSEIIYNMFYKKGYLER